MATVAEPTKALHLQRLEVESFMRVHALTVDADGNHVVISGANGEGKTSALEAIWCALKGANSKEIPEPIRKGAAKASIVLNLGEYRVERRWTEKSTSLIVTAADGSRIAKPQALLDGLLGKYSLDPIAFLERRPQDQVDDVLSIVGVQPPVEAVAQLTGERLDPRPGESADAYLQRLSGDETGLYYVRRREANRVADQKRAALAEQRQHLEGLGGALKASEAPQSAAELLGQIERLQQDADSRRALLAEFDEARKAHVDASGLLAQLRSEVDDKDTEIAEAERRLMQLRKDREMLNERIAKGTPIVRQLEEESETYEQRLLKTPDPSPEIARLRSQVATVESTNARTAKRKAAQEQLDRLAREHEHAAAEHKKLDDVLGQLRELRAHLLDGVDLGVPGLEVGAGELRLDGVTFRQASQAQQIRVACAVAMRQQPRLRLLRVDEGERLDRRSKELLLQLADQHGYQVVMTQVADVDSLRVEIVEGGE